MNGRGRSRMRERRLEGKRETANDRERMLEGERKRERDRE